MTKPKSKSKRESHAPHLDELDDVDALFFLSEDEPRSSGELRPARSKSPSPKEPAKIVALVSRKGGTGKTSLAMNLAAYLTTRRRTVLVLDLDRGGDAAKWKQRGQGLPFAVEQVDSRGGEKEFRKRLDALSADADLMILDTPPANLKAVAMAVEVADLVLIPTGPSALDLMATVEVVRDSLEDGSNGGGATPRVALVPSRLISGTRLAKDLPRQLKKLSLPVAPIIGQRVEVAAAGSEGRAVRPKSQAGIEISRLARFVVKNLRST